MERKRAAVSRQSVVKVILLVDDEEAVRALAREIPEARCPGSLCEAHHRPIDLLVSDVEMAELGGHELDRVLSNFEPA